MNRQDFQQISNMRVSEARTLLEAGHYSGAYYLIGYAVECALKACVSKQVKQYDFPDKTFANKVYTHDVQKLVSLAGLAPDFEHDQQTDRDLELNWAVVKDWSESTRYDYSITKAQADDMYLACTGQSGVLPWIRKKW